MAGSLVNEWSGDKSQEQARHFASVECTVDHVFHQSKLQPLKRISSKHYSFTDIQSKVKAFSQDKPTDINAAPDASVLREVSQTEPEYGLIAEFNPPDPAIRSLADGRFAINDTPWYLSPTVRQRIKLSAWKDSNSLYRSRLTFHL